MALSLASVMGNLVVALFVLVCLTLILIILLQKGRGGGIGAAFGGGGAGSLLGTKTGDFLTWVTICLVAGFLVLAVLMGKFMRPSGVSLDLPAPLGAETTAVNEPEAPDTKAGEATVNTTAAEVSEETPATTEEAAQPAKDTAAAEKTSSDAAPASEPSEVNE